MTVLDDFSFQSQAKKKKKKKRKKDMLNTCPPTNNSKEADVSEAPSKGILCLSNLPAFTPCHQKSVARE